MTDRGSDQQGREGEAEQAQRRAFDAQREADVFKANLRAPSRGATRWLVGLGAAATITIVVVVGLLFWVVSSMGAPGRPMRVAGIRVLPRVRRARRRIASSASGEPALLSVPDKTRRLLADEWLADARAELASVPAFEHLAMNLRLAGAPEALVAWARRAALEEKGHASTCFAIASTYADRELSASPHLFVPSWRARRESRSALIRRLAIESLVDGCIEEAVAADCARLGAEQAEDPVIRGALERIAREEAGHADLAFAIVEWARHEEPSITHALRASLEQSRRRLRPPGVATMSLLRHGRPDAASRHALAEEAHDRLLGDIDARVAASAAA